MKKVRYIIKIALALAISGVSYASDARTWEVDSGDSLNLTKVYFSDEQTLLSSSYNYVVTYWFFDEAKGDFVAVGAGVTADLTFGSDDFQGNFYWDSQPNAVLNLQPNKEYHYAIRIFSDAEMISLFDTGAVNTPGSSAWYGRIDLSPDGIAAAWARAEAAWEMGVGEIGDFEFTMTSTPAGSPGVLSSDSDWWKNAHMSVDDPNNPDGHHKYFLKAHTVPVPEPSTWLLFGAGAAFLIISRRRKKGNHR